MKKKLIYSLLLSVTSVSLLFGCSAEEQKEKTVEITNNNEVSDIENNNDINTTTNNVNLESNFKPNEFLDIKTKDSLHFDGIVEYGHTMTLSNFNKDNDSSEYVTTILEDDLSGKNQNKPFDVTYKSSIDGVKLFIQDNNQNRENPFGIIENKILIPSKNEVGFPFVQEVLIDGVTYTLNSVIKESSENQIQVYSYIDGIDGYLNQKYEETNLVDSKLGIIEHSHTLPLYEDENGEMKSYGFDFSFSHISNN